VLTLAAIIGATLSNDFATFTAFRSLQGLFGTIPQVVGLPIIHDMYAPEGKSSFRTDLDVENTT
jgi:MFS family permease